MNAIISPDYYYVLTVAGQSNAMAYGEGLPLPDREDAPHPRIKQLARFAHTHPGGPSCHFNDIIPLTHCPHDVQDMQGYHHPLATNHQTQYGTVGQALHIARKLLPFIPDNAGVLIVPCCRGGSAFTAGSEGTYSERHGASHDACRWGTDTPLYQDLVSRTRAALAKNPHNKFLGVCWMQGEFDLMTSDYASHPQHFNHMVEAFRRDLKQYHSQLNNITDAPWFCGDTTWYWKENFPHAYEAIYGNYQNNVLANIIFVDFQQQGERGLTNAPDEDPDDLSTGYYGSAYRSPENWTTALRSSHFSTAARRGIISDRFVEAILQFWRER